MILEGKMTGIDLYVRCVTLHYNMADFCRGGSRKRRDEFTNQIVTAMVRVWADNEGSGRYG